VPQATLVDVIEEGRFEDWVLKSKERLCSRAQLEISDITVLPNTVRPRGDDFVLIEMPNSPKLLFRVTNFKMNTIQSNDFYMFDADLYAVGEDADKIEKLVVEKYRCIFENIGTQNNCFVTDETFASAEGLLATLNTLVDMYHHMYYYNNENIYAFIDYIYDDTSFTDPDPNWNDYRYIFSGDYVYDPNHMRMPPPKDVTYYDIYLIKFIMDSGIFFNSEDNSTTSIVTYDDFEPPRFDYLFNQTIWRAIIKKDTSLLNKYMYYFINKINKYTSVIKNNFPNGVDNTLVSLNNERYGDYYFDKDLLAMLADGKPEDDSNKDNNQEIDIVNLQPLMNGGNELSLKDHIDINLYDVEKVKDDSSQVNAELQYIFDIIYNYIYGIDFNIDGKLLIKYFKTPSFWNFRYHLIIIYILKKKYESIFS
jgi:hypothetical protein